MTGFTESVVAQAGPDWLAGRDGARLRVALAGAGWVSAHHLAGWRRLSGVEIVAICDPDRARAEAAARQWGISGVYTDPARMLDEAHPDALDIAASVQAHAALCRLAADRGVDVLCQKPLCATLSEARETVHALAGRVRLMVHENWRFRPHYRRIKAWIDEGAVGRPVSCRFVVRASGLLPDASGRIAQLDRQAFFAKLPRLLIGEVLVHHLDVARWLLGSLDLAAARTARTSAAVVGEDSALLLLYGPECWATIDGNLAFPGASSKASDEFELVGRDGVITFAGATAELHGRTSERVTFDPEASYLDSYAGAIAHFVHALRSSTRFEITGEDHLGTLALVEAAYEAAARGLATVR